MAVKLFLVGIFTLATLCGDAFARAAAEDVKDPGLHGAVIIGPAPEYQCEGNGAYPHETLCEYFYECWEDVTPQLWMCTDLQLFSLEFRGCDFADNVDCGDRIRPTGYPGTGTPPITDTTTTPTTTAGTTTTTTAATTTTITTTTTPTTTTTAGTTTTTTTTTERPDFDCPADGFYPHPSDCHLYYYCFAGYPFPFECPEDLYFNPETDECDYQENVDCQNFQGVKNH